MEEEKTEVQEPSKFKLSVMITLCHVFLIIIIRNESNRALCSVDEGGNNELKLCLSNFIAFHRLNLVKISKPLPWLCENLNG